MQPRFRQNVTSLNLNAPGTPQNVVINEDNGIQLQTVQANNFTVNAGLVSAGNITTFTDFSVGGNLVLDNNNGQIQLNNNVGATGNVTLDATGTITQLGGTKITGNVLTANFGVTSVALRTAIGTVNSTAPGLALTINDDNGVIVGTTINLNSLTINAGQTGAGTITTSADVSVAGNLLFNNDNGDINLQHNVTGTTAVTLEASTTITQTPGRKVNGGALTVAAGAGSTTLATNVTSLTTNAAGLSVFIDEDNGIQLLGQNAGQLSVTAGLTGAGNITTANDFTVGDLTLSNNNTTSNIVLSNNIVGTNTVDLNVVGSGNITQTAGTVTTASFSSSTGSGTIERQGGTGFRVTNGASAIAIEADSLTGNSNIESLGAGSVSLASSSGASLRVTAAGPITTTGNTSVSGALNLTTNLLNNSNTLQSTTGVATIQSNAGSGLTVNGGAGGNLTGGLAASGVPNAPNPSGVVLTAVGGDLTIQGTMNINNSDATFNAAGDSLVKASGALWNSANNVTFNGSVVDEQGGILNANVFIFNPSGMSGTIINTIGDVNLTSNIVFNGQNLAIIANGNITADVGVNLIDLSSVAGGVLHLVAGYSASPNSGGQINTDQPYTITGASTGSISLGAVNVNTSSTGGVANGGAITAVASNGSVNLGTITSTSAGGVGGNVLVVGETGVNVGAINVTGVTGGDVTLSVSQPQIVGGPIVFTNGTISGGSFAAGATPTAGNLVFRGTTGVDDLTLRGASGAANTIQLASGVAAANTLNVVAGSGTTTIGNSALGALNSTSSGSVTLSNEAGTLALGAISGATQSLSVTASGTISTTSDFTINNVSLTVNGPSVILLNHNIGGTTSVSLDSSGGWVQAVGKTVSGGALTLSNDIAPAVLSTDVASLTTTVARGLTINEANSIQLLSQDINFAGLTVNANGTITTGANISVTGPLRLECARCNLDLQLGNNTITSDSGVTLTAGRTIASTGLISGTALQVGFVSGPVTLSTAVTSLSTTGGTSLTVNEANAIQVNGQGVNSLIVNSNGNITTGAAVSVAGQLTLNAQGATSDIILTNNINGTTGVTLNAGRTLSSTGTVSGGALQVGFGSGTTMLSTNVTSLATTSGGSLIVSEANGIQLLTQGVTNLNVSTTDAALTTGATVSVSGNLFLTAGGTAFGLGSMALTNDVHGGTSVTLLSGSTLTSTGVISGGVLDVSFDGSTTLTTDVAALYLTAGGSNKTLTINEANAIQLQQASIQNLTVNANGNHFCCDEWAE